MKKIILNIFSILIPVSIIGQDDLHTINTEQNSSTSSLVEYMSPIDYAMMMHENTNWALKPEIRGSRLIIGGEYKISTSLSINGYSSFDLYNEDLSSSFEPRWYFQQRNLIEKKKMASNLSGKYLGFGVNYTKYGRYSDQKGNMLSASLSFGIQKRLLKNIFVNYGFRVGVGNSSQQKKHNLILRSFVDLGLFFTKRSPQLDLEKLCPVLKCYDSESFLVKVNLFWLTNFEIEPNKKTLLARPSIELEKKIGQLPLSVNAKIGLQWAYFNEKRSGSYYTYHHKEQLLHLDLGGQIRYYYNLRKRILLGKSGNGLSANYFSIGSTYRSQIKKSGINETTTLFVSWGIQRTFSDHIYVDFNFGPGIRIEYFSESPNPAYVYKQIYPDVPINIGIGYRF